MIPAHVYMPVYMTAGCGMQQDPGPSLPEDPSSWHVPDTGTSQSMLYDYSSSTWTLTDPKPVRWHPPHAPANFVMYTYPNRAWAVYPRNLSQLTTVFSAEMGVCGEEGGLQRVLIQYDADRWVHSLTHEQYSV